MIFPWDGKVYILFLERKRIKKNFRNFCRHQGKLNPGPETVRAEGGVAMSGKKNSGDPMEKAMDLTIWQSAKTDPQGSYTGTPADPYEVPVQDADDL